MLATAEIVEMQTRAEDHVRRLKPAAVIKFERERARVRAELGLPPVPVTSKGRTVLRAARYKIDQQGCLTLQ